jgi:PKD repeat protein
MFIGEFGGEVRMACWRRALPAAYLLPIVLVLSLVPGSVLAAPATTVPLPHTHSFTAPDGPASPRSSGNSIRSLLGGQSVLQFAERMERPLDLNPSALPSASVGPSYADMHWWNVSSLVAGQPSSRVLAQMAYNPVDQEDVLFGGIVSGSGHFLSDTWVFANGTWTNVTSASPHHPPQLAAGEMAFDPTENDIVLTGGVTPTQNPARPDTWVFRHNIWTNITATAGKPYATLAGELAADDYDGLDVLTGGVGQNSGGLPDLYTWEFANDTWTNITTAAGPGPEQSIFIDASTDFNDNGAIFFGGETPHPVATTWLYSMHHWQNLTATAGSPLDAGDFYLFGELAPSTWTGDPILSTGEQIGATSQLFTWTWAFDAGTWENITSTVGLLPPMLEGEAAEDVTNGIITADGASIGGPLYGTWELVVPVFAGASSNVTLTDVGDSVQFYSRSSGGIAFDYPTWYFGDGAYELGTWDPTHAYAKPGTYVATFYAGDVAGNTGVAEVTIFVAQNLSASASASVLTADVGQADAFTGTYAGGTGAYSFQWAFGDGQTATTQSATHTYAAAGAEIATFSVTDSLGRVATGNVHVDVNPSPTLAASSSASTVVAGTADAFTPTVTGGTGPFSYLWNFTDGTDSVATAPSHAFSKAGVYNVTVMVTDANGETAAANVKVSVVAPLAVTLSVAPSGGSTFTSFAFTATATGGAGPYTYAWNFGDSATGSGATASHQYTATGNYTVTVTATDSAGRTATATTVVSVTPPPAAPSSSSSSSGLSTEALGIIGLLAVLAALFAVLWVTKGRKPKPAAAAPAATAPAPPPAAAPEPAPAPPAPSEGSVAAPPPPPPPA